MRDWSASAPATLMLMGEHAVLHKKRAISCAVDSRITVHVKRRSDDKVHIHSSLANYESTIHTLHDDPLLRFVLACLDGLEQGIKITIESQFSDQVGLGSSAAVTVATLAALHGPDCGPMDLFKKALEVVRKVQGTGSGADLAASVFGGAVLYRMEPLEITKLSYTLPLTLIYSGSKMKTPDVIRHVARLQAKMPKLYEAAYTLMDELVEQASQESDLEKLGQLFNMHHGLQEAIGTCNAPLAEIVHLLRQEKAIYGAKITGSGLGDCVVGLGNAALHSQYHFQYRQIEVAMSREGVMYL